MPLLLYNSLALQLKEDENWPDQRFITALALSCWPFGTFIFERCFRVLGASLLGNGIESKVMAGENGGLVIGA